MEPVPQKSVSFRSALSRTSGAFTAEYSVFLISLGVALSNLAALVYVFFGLIVDSMNDGMMSGSVPSHMFTLWLAISSLVALPVAAILWSRVQGEITQNKDFKGELPKGAAKGFRTFWIVLNILGIMSMFMVAIYAPVVTALNGMMASQVLLSVTLPSILSIGISLAGLYIVTRGIRERGRTRLYLWVVAGLTLLLFAINYLWASHMAQNSTRSTRPYYSDPYETRDTYRKYNSQPDYR